MVLVSVTIIGGASDYGYRNSLAEMLVIGGAKDHGYQHPIQGLSLSFMLCISTVALGSEMT